MIRSNSGIVKNEEPHRKRWGVEILPKPTLLLVLRSEATSQSSALKLRKGSPRHSLSPRSVAEAMERKRQTARDSGEGE